MPQVEYRIDVFVDDSKLEGKLNDLGFSRWELVTCIPDKRLVKRRSEVGLDFPVYENVLRCIFKRMTLSEEVSCG